MDKAMAVKIVKFRIAYSVFLIFAAALLRADSYSSSDFHQTQIIRAPIWVFLEVQPGVMESSEQGPQLPPWQALTELSKTVLEGMTYGWRFSYTPFDKRRNVAETFELTALQSIAPDDSRLSITELRPQYPYLYCWAEYRITEAMAHKRAEWFRIGSVTAKGSGSAERKREIEGIRQAYREAALAAIRGHLRKALKNKPQCVSGEMLIKDNPRLYASSGRFTAELTVCVNITEIIPYEVF